MPEVTHTCEHHGQTSLVRGRDNVIIADRTARLNDRARAGLGRAAVAATAVALLAVWIANGFRANDRREYTWARDYAVAILESLRPNAVLLLGNEWDTPTIGYAHEVEGVRPDIVLYDDLGVGLRRRIFDPKAPPAERARALLAFVRAERRPLFFIRRARKSILESKLEP